MNWQALRYFRPAIFVFLFLNIGFFSLQKKLTGWGFDQDVLVYGNIILFVISLISFMMGAKGLESKNNHVFIRLVYGSFIVKLFLLAGAAFVYIMAMKKNVNKPALILCMGLYIVYTVIEVAALMKTGKKKTNA
jgi:hypothetical protein